MSREDWSFLSSCYEMFVDRNPELHTMLVDHYRCHPAIIGFSNREIYGNQLIIHESESDKRTSCPISIRWYQGDYREGMWPNEALPREESPDKKVRSTYVNEKQLLILIEEEGPRLRKLVEKGKSICLLSPFRGQIYRLRSTLAYILDGLVAESEIEVEVVDSSDERDTAVGNEEEAPVALTIHKSQGQEFDVVYLLPVEDGNWEWPWSQGMRLVNVAVTRAKSELRMILSTKLMSKRMQKRLVGKIAWVKKPAHEEDDVKNQEMYIRKFVDYTWDYIENLQGENAEQHERWSAMGVHGFFETSVVSIFDDIPYLQEPRKKNSDSAPERCVERALEGMCIPGVAWAKQVTFDRLAFEDKTSLSDYCRARYEDPDHVHFDFVVYDEATRRVLVALEVDGAQHRFKKRNGRLSLDQMIMDRKKDGVVRDVCGAAPARLAFAHGENCQKWFQAEGEADVVEPADERFGEYAPSVQWVLYPSRVPDDATFTFLRIPSNGSTFCEFDALRPRASDVLAVKETRRKTMPPTVEEYVRRQMKINKGSASGRGLFLRGDSK